jgi:hypothetical protein
MSFDLLGWIWRCGVHALSLFIAFVVGVMVHFAIEGWMPLRLDDSTNGFQATVDAVNRRCEIAGYCSAGVFLVMAVAGAIFVERHWRSNRIQTLVVCA